MIEIQSGNHDNILSLRVSGNVTERDLRLLDSQLKALTEQHDQVRLLVDYEELSGFDLTALDDDLRLMRYMGDLERIAVVSDRRIYDWMTSVSDRVAMQTDIRHFERKDIDRAWDWLE